MNIKLTSLALALAAAAVAPGAMAADNLTITGNITENTCMANFETPVMSLTMPNIGREMIGERSHGTTLNVGVKCEGLGSDTAVSISFAGDGDANGNLVADAADETYTGQGVSFLLVDEDGAQVRMNGTANKRYPVASGGRTNIKHTVYYAANGDAIVTGPVKASAEMLITYR
ncbi:TPA: fimbrial protein [Stenotrophomonas maltophilia]